MDIAAELGMCEEKEVISPNEVLVITDSKATPATVFPGGQVRLTVFLENVDPERDLPIEEGQAISAELYDHWIFTVDSSPRPKSISFCDGDLNCPNMKPAEGVTESSACHYYNGMGLCEWVGGCELKGGYGEPNCDVYDGEEGICTNPPVNRLCKWENGYCEPREGRLCSNLDEHNCEQLEELGCYWDATCQNIPGKTCRDVPTGFCQGDEPPQIIKNLDCEYIEKINIPSVPGIPPGGTRKVEWTLTAPNEEQMAGVKSDVNLKYRFVFPFEGKTTRELIVMPEDEYYSILNSGEEFPVMGQTKTGGPIKAFVEIGTERPLISENEFPLYLTLKNVGKGFVHEGRVNSDELTISFPEDLIDCNVPENMFKEEEFDCTKKCICTSQRGLRFFEDSTDRYVFNLKADSDRRPYVTKNIQVEFNYTYEMRGEERVTVQPYD